LAPNICSSLSELAPLRFSQLRLARQSKCLAQSNESRTGRSDQQAEKFQLGNSDFVILLNINSAATAQ